MAVVAIANDKITSVVSNDERRERFNGGRGVLELTDPLRPGARLRPELHLGFRPTGTAKARKGRPHWTAQVRRLTSQTLGELRVLPWTAQVAMHPSLKFASLSRPFGCGEIKGLHA